jgi:hypothetical protein
VVVNLDGLVNNEMYPYILKRRQAEYVRKSGIAYLVDDTRTVDDWGGFWAGAGGSMWPSLQVVSSVWHWPSAGPAMLQPHVGIASRAVRVPAEVGLYIMKVLPER